MEKFYFETRGLAGFGGGGGGNKLTLGQKVCFRLRNKRFRAPGKRLVSGSGNNGFEPEKVCVYDRKQTFQRPARKTKVSKLFESRQMRLGNLMVRWRVSRHSGLVQYGPAGSCMQQMSLVQDLRAMEVVLEFNASIVTEHIWNEALPWIVFKLFCWVKRCQCTQIC